MNSFVQPRYNLQHAGVERFVRGIRCVGGLLRGVTSTLSVCATFVAAMVSALKGAVKDAAQRRADARLLLLARNDPRVMAELQAAADRQSDR
jgi:hypothetical protein